MADVAQLGIQVRSDGVIGATNRLRDMERQSGRSESAIMRMAKNLKAAFAGMAIAAAAMFGGRRRSAPSLASRRPWRPWERLRAPPRTT